MEVPLWYCKNTEIVLTTEIPVEACETDRREGEKVVCPRSGAVPAGKQDPNLIFLGLGK